MCRIDEEIRTWIESIARDLLDEGDRASVQASIVVGGGDRPDEDRLILVANQRARGLLIGPGGRTVDALRRLVRVRRRSLGRERALDVRVEPPGGEPDVPTTRRRVFTPA